MNTKELPSYRKYFGEKAEQMDRGWIKSFGIPLESTYCKTREMSEMLFFTSLVASHQLHELIKSVSYDSKSQICNIELNQSVDQYSDEACLIKNAAELSISVFDWFGETIVGNTVFDNSLQDYRNLKS